MGSFHPSTLSEQAQSELGLVEPTKRQAYAPVGLWPLLVDQAFRFPGRIPLAPQSPFELKPGASLQNFA